MLDLTNILEESHKVPVAPTSAAARHPINNQQSTINNDPDRSSAYALPALCLGIAMIACCLLIPAADENGQLVRQREQLKADLTQIQKQVAVNDQFLKRVEDDPNLLERLAQRQMKMVRAGSSVLELQQVSTERAQTSPFTLLTLPPPAAQAEFRPTGGKLAALCRNPRSRLLMMGAGLMLMAFGLVTGTTVRTAKE